LHVSRFAVCTAEPSYTASTNTQYQKCAACETLLKPHLLSASSFSINGEYSVADDLGPYLHNTGQAELVQFTT